METKKQANCMQNKKPGNDPPNLSSIYPGTASLSEIKLDRFRRETVAEFYSSDTSLSLRKLSESRERLDSDVSAAVDSLEFKKRYCTADISNLEQVKITAIKDTKEAERVRYAEIFRGNHERMEAEYQKRASALKEWKEKQLKALQEWFELKFYTSSPENHPSVYLSEAVKKNGFGFAKCVSSEQQRSDLECEMVEGLVQINRIKNEKADLIEEKYSEQMKGLDKRYAEFKKEVTGKEIEAIRGLNQKYAERIESAKKEFLDLLSVQIDRINMLIINIKAKRDLALDEISMEEATVENGFRDNLKALLDPKQKIPESLASKYLYCLLKKEEVAKKAEEKAEKTKIQANGGLEAQVKKPEIQEKKLEPAIEAPAAENGKPKPGFARLAKLASYSLALGGLVYFYPDLVQKQIPDSVSKTVSEVYINSKFKAPLISHEIMRKNSGLKLKQKSERTASIQKREYAPVQLPDSPLLESTRQSSKKFGSDPITDKLAASGIILDLQGFFEEKRDVDSRFLAVRSALAADSAYLSKVGHGFLGFGKSDESISQSILNEIDSKKLSVSQKKAVTSVLASLNGKNLNRANLVSAHSKIKAIVGSESGQPELLEWISRTPRIENSPLVPAEYVRPAIKQDAVTPQKDPEAKPDVPKQQEPKVQKVESAVQVIESDISEIFEKVELVGKDVAPMRGVSDPSEGDSTGVAPVAEPAVQEEIQPDVEVRSFDQNGEPASEPAEREISIIMCGDRPVYIKHDAGMAPEDNDPNLCE